jgi:hypothetical protein
VSGKKLLRRVRVHLPPVMMLESQSSPCTGKTDELSAQTRGRERKGTTYLFQPFTRQCATAPNAPLSALFSSRKSQPIANFSTRQRTRHILTQRKSSSGLKHRIEGEVKETYLLVGKHEHGHILELLLGQHRQQLRARCRQAGNVRRIDDVNDCLSVVD